MICHPHEIIAIGLAHPLHRDRAARCLAERWPRHRFRIIVGADNWRDFAAWRDARGIIERFGVIVYPRPGISLPPDFTPVGGVSLDKVTVLDGNPPESPASSTAIRDALENSRPVPPGMMDSEVEQAVSLSGIYTGRSARR